MMTPIYIRKRNNPIPFVPLTGVPIARSIVRYAYSINGSIQRCSKMGRQR